MAKNKATINKLSSEEFRKLVSDSTSRSDMFIALGLRKGGEAFRVLNHRLKVEAVDVSHFITSGHSGAKGNNRKYIEEEVYCCNSKMRDIRSRVVSDNFMEYKCKECDSDAQWRGKPLTLHLDHINGIGNDNRKENLRWLCPNCHTQTPTYCARNYCARNLRYA